MLMQRVWMINEIATLLHEIGDSEGFDLLKAAVDGHWGHAALYATAMRDTPQVRKLLKERLEHESPAFRSAAIAGQIRLGLYENLSVALSILASGDESSVMCVVDAIGRSDRGLDGHLEASGREVLEVVRAVADRKDLPWSLRVSAMSCLDRLGDERGIALLIDSWHKTSGAVERIPVYLALSRVARDARVMDLMRRALRSETIDLRDYAVCATAHLVSR